MLQVRQPGLPHFPQQALRQAAALDGERAKLPMSQLAEGEVAHPADAELLQLREGGQQGGDVARSDPRNRTLLVSNVPEEEGTKLRHPATIRHQGLDNSRRPPSSLA